MHDVIVVSEQSQIGTARLVYLHEGWTIEDSVDHTMGES